MNVLKETCPFQKPIPLTGSSSISISKRDYRFQRSKKTIPTKKEKETLMNISKKTRPSQKSISLTGSKGSKKAVDNTVY